MAQTVIGIFDSSSEAQKAVQELRNLGISNDRIDISNASSGVTSSSSGMSNTASASYGNEESNDGISGFFKSLFGDDNDNARSYSQVARQSDCLVTVHAQSESEARQAATILDQYGSIDVNARASQYGYTSNAWTDQTRQNRQDTTSIPIIEENLQVGKREVETGGARLHSRIVERPVEEHLRLRSEHVRIERQPVNRPATEADFTNFKEGDIELTERAEVAMVNKEARVVEEISLGKEVEERDEVIRDTVRSTEVDIDDQTTDRTRFNNDNRTNDRTDFDEDRPKSL